MCIRGFILNRVNEGEFIFFLYIFLKKVSLLFGVGKLLFKDDKCVEVKRCLKIGKDWERCIKYIF